MFRVPPIILEGNGVQSRWSSVERRSIGESLSINGKTHLTSITVPANIETDVFRGGDARQQLKIECLLQRNPLFPRDSIPFIGNHVFPTFLNFVTATSDNSTLIPRQILPTFDENQQEDVRRRRVESKVELHEK